MAHTPDPFTDRPRDSSSSSAPNAPRGRRSPTGELGDHHGTTIPAPADEQVVYRVDEHDQGRTVHRKRLDVPATLGGTLAALGALLLLSSLIAAAVGTIGYQSGLDDQDLSIGGLIGGLVVLFLACLIGGWVAGRIAHHRGALHGLIAIAWLVILAGALAALAAIFGDDLDVTDQVGLPSWFSQDAFTTTAIITGVIALLLALLGGWLGGRLANRHRHDENLTVVETRRNVRERSGGIIDGRRG